MYFIYLKTAINDKGINLTVALANHKLKLLTKEVLSLQRTRGADVIINCSGVCDYSRFDSYANLH